MAAHVGSFMVRVRALVLMPTFNLKPYQLRNIIICAKRTEKVTANNQTPPIKPGDPPQHHDIGQGNTHTNSITGGGDNIGNANADDVKVKKSESAN